MIKTRGRSSTSAMWRGQIAPLATRPKPGLRAMRGPGRSGYPRDPAACHETFIDAVAPFLHDLDAKPALKVAS